MGAFCDTLDVMQTILRKHSQRLFSLSTDIANTTTEEAYTRWQCPKSKQSLGDLFSEIVSAREAVRYKILHGSLSEFDCTVDSSNKLHIMKALFESSNTLLEILDQQELDTSQHSLFMSLLEWESLYHGKIISLYHQHKGMFPSSWSEYYKI